MKKINLIILILNILIAITISKIFLLTNNTLLNNGNWNSEKEKLGMWVMGSWNFFSETQPLNGGHLSLGAWHGFQEITSKKTFQYNQVEFDALIKNEAYLINHFIINNNLKISIEISGKSAENFCLTINQDGKFIEKTPLESLKIKTNQWFHAKINLNNNKATIVVDGQIFTCDIPEVIDSKIGFKGGQHDTLIDNIIVKKDHEVVFQEDFSNSKNLTLIVISIFIFLTLIQLIFSRKKSIIFILVLTNTSLLLSIVIFYLYLLLFFTGNYPNPKLFFTNLKKQEQEWLDDEVELISNKTMKDFGNDEHEKIMFIGSSQTWGAGASSYEKTFPAIFEKILNNKIIELPPDASSASQVLGVSTDQKIKIVNTGISGVTSSELLEEYQSEWIKLKPKILFINLSSNDFTYGDFETKFKNNIENFIELNENNNIRTVLLIEAGSVELNRKNPLHQILTEIAKNEKILLIDIDQYLKDKNQTGLIWWDYVHLTDYGHQLVAEYILNMVIESDESIQSTLR